MPRQKDDVWGLFTISNQSGKDCATCKHCGTQFNFPNATRMRKHIASSCKSVPPNIRYNYTGAVAQAGASAEYLEDNPQPVGPHPPQAGPGPSSSTREAAAPPRQSAGDAPPAKRRSLERFVDQTSPEEKGVLDVEFAKACYASGVALSTFDTPYWDQFFKRLRPSYKVPTPYYLRGPLLNNEYSKTVAEIDEKIQNATSLGIMTDSYTNTRGESVINIIITTPEPVLHKQIFREQNRETDEYVAEKIIQVIREVGSERFFLLVTDNAANMKAAWDIVTTEFPHITAIGCAAHCYNLLFKDLITSIPVLDLYCKRARKIVNYVKRSSNVLAVFNAKQNERYGNNYVTLKLPGKTRWGGALILLKALLRNKAALMETVISDDLDVDSSVRKYVLDNKFWDRLKCMSDLLAPLHASITLIESNKALLSDVYYLQSKFSQCITANLSQLPLSLRQKREVQDLLQERKEFTIAPIHLAAYMMDPRFQGEGLHDNEVGEAIAFISQLAARNGLDEGSVIANLGEFRTSEGFFATKSILDSAGRLHPSVWWKGVCSTQPISKIAAGLLAMPPSASEVERSWSAHGFVHSKSRNRLLNPRVTKLVTVRTHLQAAVSKTKRVECLSAPQLEDFFTNYMNGGPGDLRGGGEGDVQDREEEEEGFSDVESDSGSEWEALDSADEDDDFLDEARVPTPPPARAPLPAPSAPQTGSGNLRRSRRNR